MSSKSADATSRGTPALSQLARLSITARVTLLYTIANLGLLMAGTAILYWTILGSLESDDRDFITDKVQWLRITLRDHADEPGFLVHQVQGKLRPVDSEEHFLTYSRILDETGNVLLETPGMERQLPATLFPPPEPLNATPTNMVRWTAPDGRSYWLISAWGETGNQGRAPRMIQVGLDDTTEETLHTNYQRNSLLLLLLGTLFSAGAGVLIGHRAMRPLRDIAEAAKAITATQLHERVDPAHWPAELAAFAQAFNMMLSRLEDSFARLGRFSSDLAHELRTPIHNLMGQTEVTLSRARDPAEYRQTLESNLEEYNRLARMINGLLFLARADDPRTRMRIERTWLDVRKELEKVREFHDALAEDQGVSVTCQGEGRIECDPLLFRRGLTNLVSNALRHTPEGGTVTLAVSEPDDNVVVVMVADTGSGIAPEYLPYIFDRLYRAERVDSGFSSGTGLGLAIVKSIVDLHGGSISVESTVGKGTTFTLRFPKIAVAAT